MKVDINLPTMASSAFEESVLEDNILSDGEDKKEKKSVPVISEIIKTDKEQKPATEVKKEVKTILSKEAEEILNIEPEEEIEEYVEDENNMYFNVTQNLVDNEVIDLEELDPEDYNFSEWNEKNFSTLLTKVISKQKEKIKETEERVAQETYDYVIDQMSSITRRGFELESKGNLDPEEIKDFYRQLVYEEDVKTLDPDVPAEAELILREYYKFKGKSLEYIEDTISNLKDVVKEAKKIKPELEKNLEEIAAAKIEEQNIILAAELEMKKKTKNRLEKIFEEPTLDGITLTKDIKQFLTSVLVNDEFPVNIKGKDVLVSGAEYLMRFHAFNENKGQLKHLCKMILYLQSPDLFNQFVIKKVEKEETHRKIKENKEAASNKTTTPILNKPKISTPQKGMKFN